MRRHHKFWTRFIRGCWKMSVACSRNLLKWLRRGSRLKKCVDDRIIETFSLWREVQPRDFADMMRRQQVYDIIDWCTKHLNEDQKRLCATVKDQLSTYTADKDLDGIWPTYPTNEEEGEEEKDILEIKSWDL